MPDRAKDLRISRSAGEGLDGRGDGVRGRGDTVLDIVGVSRCARGALRRVRMQRGRWAAMKNLCAARKTCAVVTVWQRQRSIGFVDASMTIRRSINTWTWTWCTFKLCILVKCNAQRHGSSAPILSSRQARPHRRAGAPSSWSWSRIRIRNILASCSGPSRLACR